MENKVSIVEKAKEYAGSLIESGVPETYYYHNIDHAFDVWEKAAEIGAAAGLSAEELEIAEIAALFHDVGYAERYEDNEEIGARIAREFLEKQGYPEEKIKRVESAIMATQMPQNPKNIVDKVVCDADLSSFGRKSFFKKSKRIKDELEIVNNQKISDEKWIEETAELLEEHEYHTDFAKNAFDAKKRKNLELLKKMLDQDKVKFKKNPKKALKNEKADESTFFIQKPPSRGVETMFRNNLRGHIMLSEIADNKANIMLSINAIIITITIPSALPQFDSLPHIIAPTIVLLAVCLTSMIFATISTIPKVTSGAFTKEDVENKTANLLFFGNFHKMKISDFEWGIKRMMNDREFLYGSMARDFYYLGLVLSRKYKFLRVCYGVFMYGLILSVLTFLFFFFLKDSIV